MKISLIMTAPGAGGVQQSIVPYAVAFQRLGYEIQIIVYRDSELIEPLSSFGFRLTKTFTNLKKRRPTWMHISEVGYYLHKFQPDIIFAFGDKGLPVVECLKTKSVIITRCGASKIERIQRLKGANAILVTSEKIKNIAISGGLEAKSLHVIPNFTVPSFTLNKFRLDKLSLKVGGMGRLHSVKGFDKLIFAVGLLKKRGYNLDLIIAGSGPEEKTLQSISDKFGVNTNFVGWVKGAEKNSFLQSLDIFVCPSREEPFGFVFLEAMEFGLPIVTTKTIGALEIFKNHDGAFLSEVEDTYSMACNIERLLIEKELRHEMGEKNRRAYLEKFSIDTGTKTLGDLMSSILQQHNIKT